MLVFHQKQTFCKHLRPCWQNHFSTDEAVLWSSSNSESPHHSVPLSALDLSLLLYQSQLSSASLLLPINTSQKDLRFSSLHEIYGPKMDSNVLWCDCFIISRMYLVDLDFSLSLSLSLSLSFSNGDSLFW